jgi:transposase
VAVPAPLLPAASPTGRPPKWEKRKLIDRIRIGAPWCDVPADYAPWPTIYGLFRRWQRDGTWDRILSALQAQSRIDWTTSADSMTSRAHQHAAGAALRRTASPDSNATVASPPDTTSQPSASKPF